MRNWSIRGVVHRISYTTAAGIGTDWPVSPTRPRWQSPACPAAPEARKCPRHPRRGSGPAAAEARKWPACSWSRSLRCSICTKSSWIMKIECSSGSWPMRLGLAGPVVQHGTLQPRILYRPPASLLWLIVQRHRKCVASGGVRSASAAVLGRLVELWLCRPGRSRAGDTEKPKSFEKKAPRVSSRPRSRRDHLRGERDWRGRVRQCCARQRLPPWGGCALRRRPLWRGLRSVAPPAV